MDMSALLSSTPPAVAIEEPVWAQMVSYPLAPACERAAAAADLPRF